MDKHAYQVIRSPLMTCRQACNWSPGWTDSSGGFQSVLARWSSPVYRESIDGSLHRSVLQVRFEQHSYQPVKQPRRNSKTSPLDALQVRDHSENPFAMYMQD